VKFLRKQKHWSQEDLALEINVNKNNLSDIECGRRNPTLKIMNKIAKGLKVDLATLLLGVGNKNK
ncbi:MAG: helix-turn-helix domain-containing protein, partial [Clostridia bacterium]|nr:helix-turn-helix domain-containing protein [Clostridia bacterium]